MCRQRQNSLQNLREMRRPPTPTLIYRGKWMWIMSNGILPGDVISLSSEPPKLEQNEEISQEQQNSNDGYNPSQSLQAVVPCDALIIRGGCVANEAMLTGE